MGLAGAIKELADSQPARATSTARRQRPAPERDEAANGQPPRRTPDRADASEGQNDAPGVDRAAPTEARLSVRSAPPPPVRQGASAEPQPTRLASPAAGAFSLAELWPPGDQEAARRAEQLLGDRDAAGAILACEDLVSRVLAAGSVWLGGQAHTPEPGLVVALLGLDGARYLAFRAVVRAVRSKRTPTLRDALECYAFAVDARRKLDRTGK